MKRAFRLCTTALGAVWLAGCTLPYEQLSTPGPVTPPLHEGATLPTSTTGTPMSNPASQPPDTNRLYEGSGTFARTAWSAQSTADPAPATAQPSTPPVAGGTPADPASQTTKDGITLNLANASVAEAAKTVLGDVLGATYIVSDKVNATITLRTAHPVDKAALLEIFEAVLRAENIAIVSDGGIYKIVPSSEAAASGAPFRRRGDSREASLGVSSEIVPLRFVAAAEMERILRSAAPNAAVLRVDENRNLLLISGTKAELGSMTELVRVFDVDWMRGMSFGVFPVETSDPDAIAQELDVIFANDKESPSKGLVRFVPNRRLKSVLVITSRPEYLKKAETWISRIDLAAASTEKRVFVYHVQNRPANEVAQLLQKVYRTSGSNSQQSGANVATGGILDPRLDGAGVPGPDQPIFTSPSQPGIPQLPASPQQPAPQASAALANPLDPNAPIDEGQAPKSTIGSGLPPDDRSNAISIVADEANNSIVITATAAEYRRMQNMLRSVDVAGTQVLIESTIAEVTLTDELKFGVRWFLEKGGSRLTLTDSLTGLVNPAFPGFSYFLNVSNVRAVVNALSTVTDVNIVSSPSLTVMENKKATLQVGDEVPIATQSAVAIQVPGAPIVNSVSFRSTGVILGITPRVSDNGKIVLDIEQEVSDVVRTTTSDIDSPTIQQRRIKTTVNVQDGQAIVLAGMIQDRAERERGQIPLLGDLPYVGNAFKNKTDTIRRTELLIAITPHVLKDRQQIDDVAAEYRDKLNLSTRPQRSAPPDRRENFDRLIR